MICLKKANREDLEKEWLFVREMPEDENGLTNAWHDVSREEFENKALPSMLRFAEGKDLPDGYVPETFYFLWKDDEIAGQFRIRHYLCESLRTGAGHIGYFIAKPFRGQGLGTEGLRLTLEEAHRIVPEEEIYLRVNLDNPASLHVMLNNGGRVVSQDEEHYFVRIPNPGKGGIPHMVSGTKGLDQSLRISYVSPGDRAFWFSLDHHLSEEAFAGKVRDQMGLVLSVGNEPVGILRWSLFWDSIPFCNLLYIKEAWQRKGYGRKLMEYWEEKMHCTGHDLVMTSTQADEEAQHFYRALGYRDCGGLMLPFPGYEQPMELILAKALAGDK